MITLNNCPVCDKQSFSDSLTCIDYTVSGEKFSLVVCDNCGLKFTNPRPSDERISDYYKSEDYISHTNTKIGLISKLYHLVRNYTLKRKLELVGRYVSRGTMLDYGCGAGMFLNTAQKAGWRVIGLEPDFGARQIAGGHILDVFSGKESLLENQPDVKFDAITLWHVLEHVTDLEETMRFLKTRLQPSGVLVIAVPNHKSSDAVFYKEFWAAYDVPRHLYHFHEATISLLLNKYGFQLVATHPMKFDSFYVSMLSEKYLTGSIRYLRAFLAGLSSNKKARSTNQYSSRIYVCKHG